MKNNFDRLVTGILIAIASSLWAQGSGTQPEDGQLPAPEAAVHSITPAAKNTPDNFIIGSDDVLSINVWKEPEITRSIPVRSDGKISLPLVGEIQAAGQTPSQLEKEISDKLRSYISDPQVTVIVQQINSQKFNILGQVQKPGSYSLTQSTTVLDAIAAAGGLRDFAKKKSIYVLRASSKGGASKIEFNYKAVIDGKHPEQNIKIEPRDTIVVP